MINRNILRASAACIVFLVLSDGFVAGRETSKIAALSVDSQIASLLIKIESGLRDNQTASSVGLLDMLISAKSLMPDATPGGTRLMQDFPGRLIALANEESKAGELAKSINLKVFAASAAPLVSDGHKIVADQQEIATAHPTKIVPKDDVTVVLSLQQNVAAAKPMAHAKPTVPPAIDLAMQHTLLDRGDTMLTLGDIPAARLLYQRAAEFGVAIAAFKLANTYDSAFLVEHQDLRSVRPDVQQAAMWYRKAQELGEPHAEQRLNALSEQLRKGS
jgi:hypothetical protein